MILDESTISDALHAATDQVIVSSDLVVRARRGGSRRLRHRRIGAAMAGVATVAAVASAAVALAPGTASRGSLQVAGGPSALPPPRSCDGTASDPHRGAAPPASYPQLLMLPRDQPVTYAFTNTGGAPRCAYFPHVALTLLHETAGHVTRGVEVDGPNAPSAVQFGDAGPGMQFSGRTLHPLVDGMPATVYYRAMVRSAEVFWSGPGTDQWHATTHGLGPAAIERLLRRLRFDPQAGTATLPGAAARGWTTAPAAPDAEGPQLGVFYALWHESGSKVAMWVAPGPNRIDQDAVSGGRLVTVSGGPAVVRTLRDVVVMQWQVSDDVTAFLAVTHSTATRIRQVAAGLVPISPNDPRMHRPK